METANIVRAAMSEESKCCRILFGEMRSTNKIPIIKPERMILFGMRRCCQSTIATSSISRMKVEFHAYSAEIPFLRKRRTTIIAAMHSIAGYCQEILKQQLLHLLRPRK